MASFIANQKCWVIVSDPADPTITEVDEGSSFVSKNNIIEVFYDENLAHSRMRQFIPSWKPPTDMVDIQPSGYQPPIGAPYFPPIPAPPGI